MEEKGRYYIKDYEVAHMTSYSNYPQALLDVMQVRGLIGSRSEIVDEDVNVSAFQLERGTHYAAHAHRFPEIYVFLAGSAECVWGEERFTATPGTVTHCPSHVSHAMRVTSQEPLRAIIISWAPEGDRSVWDNPSKLLDAE